MRVGRALSRVLLCSGAVACFFAIAAGVANAAAPRYKDSSLSSTQRIQNYGRLPLSFEANQGQADARVRFFSRGPSYSLYFTDSGAVLALTKAAPVHKRFAPVVTDVIGMELTGAGSSLSVAGSDRLPGNANYFLGSDSAQWRSNIPTYAKVRYAQVYDGVDLVYYGNGRQLEYDFVVAPKANPGLIRLHFAGATGLSLTPTGDLTVQAKDGHVVFHAPLVYQENEGRRQHIPGKFTLLSDNSVGFSVGSYKHSQALVIDPVLVYSTFLGNYPTAAQAIVVDEEGSAYVTGYTGDVSFPVTKGAFSTTFPSHPSGPFAENFVTKLNPSGTALVYSTFLGPSGANCPIAEGIPGNSLAVDAVGNAYLGGASCASNFPVTKGAFQIKNKSASKGFPNGFVAKLNADGSQLIYSTYLGGSGPEGDGASALAVDDAGNAYLTGFTTSADFPVTKGAFQKTNHGATNAFVTKLNPDGTGLVYSTYLGGQQADSGSALALDALGHVYVTGQTSSNDFPTTEQAFQKTNRGFSGGGYNAFITKLNASGSALEYSTYLGGSANLDNLNPGAFASALALDIYDDAYIAGSVSSDDFPVTRGAFQTKNKATDTPSLTAFVTKLNPEGSGLVYSTYLGGTGADQAKTLGVDGSGNAYIAGFTGSSDFPVSAGAFQTSTPDSFGTSFVTELDPAGAELIYSTFLGGTFPYGSAASLAVDGSGILVYVAGSTGSPDFPVTEGAFQTTASDGGAFVAKLNLGAATTATKTTLVSSANPQILGRRVTFTATVRAIGTSTKPEGNIMFLVDGSPVATVKLNGDGKASFSTSGINPIGSHYIEASYDSADQDPGPSSAVLTETINP